MPNDEMQYELDFTDPTILQTDGNFDEVMKLMKEEGDAIADSWMIESPMTMTMITPNKQVLEASFLLHFYHNGNIYVMEYAPSSGDVFFIPDIQGLVVWAQQNGWKSVRPCEDLARDNTTCWKYFYETNLIDSEYLEYHFGKRGE